MHCKYLITELLYSFIVRNKYNSFYSSFKPFKYLVIEQFLCGKCIGWLYYKF